MNTENETVVSAEMLKKLREAGLAKGYEPVPDEFEQKVKELLGHNSLADMDEDMKRKRRNLEKALRRAGVPGH